MSKLSFLENVRYWACVQLKVPIVFNFYDVSGSYLLDSKEKLGCYDGKGLNVFRRYFDTEVMQANFTGFGGTDYNCIEKFLSKFDHYPEMVMIYTDGYGYLQLNDHKDKWLFLLSTLESEKHFRDLGFGTQRG